jgi:peptidoglycan hydrolase-like protein with peptidoglycan-binding domain
VDGIAGKATYAKLTGKTAATKPKKAKKKYPLPTGVFSQAKHGRKQLNKVKQIQRALNAAHFKVGKVDGYYGGKTKDAVTRFQKVHLPREVDGVYGKNVRRELNKKVN